MLQPDRYETIKIERQGKITILTLNRPERLNAVNVRMHGELSQIFYDVQTDPDTWVVVITGAGRGFCSGGDFGPDRSDETQAIRPTGLTLWQEARRIVDGLLDLEKPIIAAVNGPAAGLGATIALNCDIVIADQQARIGDPHVRMGITAGDGGAVIWPLLIGPMRAKYMLMTGELVNADQAYEMGLVNRVVEAGTCLQEAMALAERLASGPPFAIQTTKVSVNKIIKAISNLVLPLSLSLEELSMTKNDHREAVRAFQEKRTPRFQGD